MGIKKQISKGSLKLLILSILDEEESYGYEIAKSIKERSDDLLEPTEGSLYPALYKLEGAGLIISKWNDDSTPRRKYYYITKEGKKALNTERKEWEDMISVLQPYLKFEI